MFKAAARFEAALKAHDPKFRPAELFAFLDSSATVHFEAEERLMRKLEYPRIEEHVREHSDLRRLLQSVVAHWESEGESGALMMGLLGPLDFWMTEHVAKSDQAFAAFAKGLRSHPKKA